MVKKAKKKAKSKKTSKAKLAQQNALDLRNHMNDITSQIADLDRRVARLEEHCGFKVPQPAPEPQEPAAA